jgi:hypothetical protein
LALRQQFIYNWCSSDNKGFGEILNKTCIGQIGLNFKILSTSSPLGIKVIIP